MTQIFLNITQWFLSADLQSDDLAEGLRLHAHGITDRYHIQCEIGFTPQNKMHEFISEQVRTEVLLGRQHSYHEGLGRVLDDYRKRKDLIGFFSYHPKSREFDEFYYFNLPITETMKAFLIGERHRERVQTRVMASVDLCFEDAVSLSSYTFVRDWSVTQHNFCPEQPN